MKLFSDRLKQILDEINETKIKAKRSDDVLLMAVSKTHPPEAIIEAIDAKQLLFGENRVQEIEQKFPIENKEYKFNFWGVRDLNPRLPACKAGALPTELTPQGTTKMKLSLRALFVNRVVLFFPFSSTI